MEQKKSSIVTDATFLSLSPKMTTDIARRMGESLLPGECVFLFGDIGAGKTVFVNGIAVALGIREKILSPTFTISNIYEGDMPLYHFDAYRINSRDELLDTGFYDYLDGDGVVVLEWAERLGENLPDTRTEVWITTGSGDFEVAGSEDNRCIRIVCYV